MSVSPLRVHDIIIVCSGLMCGVGAAMWWCVVVDAYGVDATMWWCVTRNQLVLKEIVPLILYILFSHTHRDPPPLPPIRPVVTL